MTIPEQIAAAVTASRGEFGDIFLRAQKEAGIPLNERFHFDAITQAGDDRQAFLQAAQYAYDNGWDEALVEEIIESDCETGILRTVRLDTSSTDVNLQAIPNIVRGLANPVQAIRGITNAMRWTGNVMVDGAPSGTGVLIAEHLFLTAWHVVGKLFRKKSGQYSPAADATERLRVVFDAVSLPGRGGQRLRQGRPVLPHRNWCPLFRTCHEDERRNSLPANLTELDGMWDFAIIRLAEAIGVERNWASLDVRIPVPRATGMLYVFQYPIGPLQRFDVHEVVAATADNQAAVPRLRFLHTVGTNPGSSGGPCFDRDFELCGLHQGEWKNSLAPTNRVNRGVPMSRICEAINSEPNNLPPLDVTERPVWSLGETAESAPVIGCDLFRADIVAAALPGGNRVINISGDPGSGKTLRLLVAELILTERNHLKVVIDTPSAAVLSAEDFGRHLCRLAGESLPQLTPPDQVNSTVALWRKDILVPAIVSVLQTARRGRTTWILVKDLNRCANFGEGTSEVLYSLYLQVLTNPWLRFVLDGMQGNVAEDLKRVTTYHLVPQFSLNDILTYLRRRTVEVELDPDTLGLPGCALGLHRRYMQNQNEPAKRGSSVKELVVSVIEAINDFLETQGI